MILKKIKKAFLVFRSSPWLFFKKLKSKFLPLLRAPCSPVLKRVNGVLYEFDFKMGHAVKKMFYNVYEPATVMIMRRVLKRGDIFIDVGANIGYFSMIALGLVGRTGQVHSFEPVPEFFARLQRMADLNPSLPSVMNQLALGEKEEMRTIYIRGNANIGWNTLLEHSMKSEYVKYKIDVPVKRLDRYLEEKKIQAKLIKIDVEGYEFPVLKGLSETLKRYRPFIICEIAPAAYPHVGYAIEEFKNYMRDYGYRAFDVCQPETPVDIVQIAELDDVFFSPI